MGATNRVTCLRVLSIFVSLCVSYTASAAPDVIEFDLSKIRQAFEGFGAQVWGFNDNPRVDQRRVLRDLNIRYIRIEALGARSKWEQLKQMRAITDELDIRWLYMCWRGPRQFNDEQTGRQLVDAQGFGRWWAQEVAELVEHGIRPEFIELMNEPDSGGGWSTGMSPTIYSDAVKATRRELDARGFEDVGIVGPGLTHLDWGRHNSMWIAALDDEAVAALAVWSSHMWDDGDLCHGGASCVEQNWPEFGQSADARDPDKSKWITEYASKEPTLHGVTYPHADRFGTYDHGKASSYYSMTSTMPFAVRVYENTLALLNNGANAVFIWQLVDEARTVQGGKSWGLVDLEGNPKPVYETLSALYPKIPVGAKVVAPPDQSGNTVYAGAFVDGERVIVAITNDSAQVATAVVRLVNGAGRLSILEATAVELAKAGDPLIGEPDTAKTRSRSLGLTAGDKPDRRNFFGIARGSVQECVPLLELASRQKLIGFDQHEQLKADLEEIAKMLSGLIKGLGNGKT